MSKEKKPKTVIIQNWEESERGYGTRPDGWTIHIDLDQHKEYVEWYNSVFNNKNEVPDCYTRTAGNPIEIECDDELYKKIKKATQRKSGGRAVGHVWGKGRLFSTRPLRPLKEIDIDFPNPLKNRKTA